MYRSSGFAECCGVFVAGLEVFIIKKNIIAGAPILWQSVCLCLILFNPLPRLHRSSFGIQTWCLPSWPSNGQRIAVTAGTDAKDAAIPGGAGAGDGNGVTVCAFQPSPKRVSLNILVIIITATTAVAGPRPSLVTFTELDNFLA